MSWFFELVGNDKETLKTAVAEEIEKAKAHRVPEAVVEKVGEAIAGALDAQLADEGYAFQVKSNGHVDQGSANGSFEIRRTKFV